MALSSEFKAEKGLWAPVGWVCAHNDTLDCNDYYLSYCNMFRNTAICGAKRTFFISLCGDHTKQLAQAKEKGKTEVIQYFCDNLHLVHEHSEHVWCAGLAERDPFDTHGAFVSVFSDQLKMLVSALTNRANSSIV